MSYFDISSLLGGYKSSGMSSINFVDYGLIRNGSYHKLMKSYVAKQKAMTTSDTEKTTTKKTKTPSLSSTTTDTTGLTKMKYEADSLKNASEELNDSELWKQTNGQYNQDKITSAIKTFANEYNDVVAQSLKVSTKSVKLQTKIMSDFTNTMSNSLSKIGVTMDSDGKMNVDTEALKKADMNDVKELFSGKHSYASQVTINASGIANAAMQNSGIYTKNGTFSSSLSSMYDMWA